MVPPEMINYASRFDLRCLNIRQWFNPWLPLMETCLKRAIQVVDIKHVGLVTFQLKQIKA